VGFKDTIIGLNRRHRQSLLARRDAARRWSHDGTISPDALIELSSIDQTVAFYDDRLEFRSRLGSKHGLIPFHDVRKVSIVGHSVTPRISTKTNTYDVVLSRPTKMSFALASAHRPVTFDFRSEPPERVNEAMDLVRRYLQASRSTADPRRAASPDDGGSRADELMKMTELHQRGVLSDEEFAREKARILDA
jgi:hypothetical protein